MSFPLQPASDDPPTVLVVEDSELLRGLTARMLQVEGYRVLTAGNGEEALEVLAKATVGLVLTDLKMPSMDGHELALTILARWPGVRMVFMTGFPEYALTFDLPGPLILKPFRLEQVTQTVKHALSGT